MEREYLIRVDEVANALEIEEQSRRVGSDFDGIELVLPREDPCRMMKDILASEESARVVEGPVFKVKAVAGGCVATDVDESLALVARLVAGAHAIGATCLNLTIPPVQRDGENQGFASYQDALNFAHVLLRRIRLEAESSGVAVALEAAVGGGLLSPVELREVIDTANSWAIGACVDVGRIRAFGSAADWLATLRHRLHSVRVGGPSGQGAQGSGSRQERLERSGIAGVLDEIGYDRIVVLEDAPTA